MGYLIARAEADLGWPRRTSKVDRRTWAALLGLGLLHTQPINPSTKTEEEAFRAGASYMIA